MRLNYYRTSANFGDSLSFVLVGQLVGKMPEGAFLPQCDMMASGSIGWGGRLFCERFKCGAVQTALQFWGFGFMQPLGESACPCPIRPIVVRAIRGALSCADMKRVGLIPQDQDIPLGDSGLLYPDLVPDVRNMPKVFDVALVPHRLDWRAGERLAEKIASAGGSLVYVDPLDYNPFDCIRAIASSRSVVASSLHALMVADALGIPNRRLVFDGYADSSARRKEQSDFRFDDYYSAFGLNSPEPLTESVVRRDARVALEASCVDPGRIEACRRSLLEAFPFGAREKVVPVLPKVECLYCRTIARELRIVDEQLRAEFQGGLLRARRERDQMAESIRKTQQEIEIYKNALASVARVMNGSVTC